MAERRERPDRQGMKTMVTFLQPDVARRIKVIAAETDRTVQDIGEEAITEWLRKHDPESANLVLKKQAEPSPVATEPVRTETTKDATAAPLTKEQSKRKQVIPPSPPSRSAPHKRTP